MGKSASLAICDVQRLTRILGEIAQHPLRPIQRQILIQQCTQWFDAKAGVLFETVLSPGSVDIRVAASGGWFSPREEALFREDAARHYYRQSPFLVALAKMSVGRCEPMAAASHDVVTRRRWHGSFYVMEVLHPLDVGSQLIVLAPDGHPGRWKGLALTRPWGDRVRFTQRQCMAATLLFEALSGLAAPDPGIEHDELPPRLREVVCFLLTGLSEKEIAAKMKLSAATVHRHVWRLYRRFGVRSRAELVARVGPELYGVT